MFEREAHQVVLEILGLLRADTLRHCRFFFGGGTRIVLELGEYRESKDIDFLCSDPRGYADLRFEATSRGFPALFTDPPQPQTSTRLSPSWRETSPTANAASKAWTSGALPTCWGDWSCCGTKEQPDSNPPRRAAPPTPRRSFSPDARRVSVGGDSDEVIIDDYDCRSAADG